MTLATPTVPLFAKSRRYKRPRPLCYICCDGLG